MDMKLQKNVKNEKRIESKKHKKYNKRYSNNIQQHNV